MEKIDFVITWVDGSDSKWLSEKERYLKLEKGQFFKDSSASRYRDWNNLHYWFRGVEKYAPWVNKIYFVTWGHVPKWLNINHPKLVIVKHEDYIPSEYLPTFSANVIENNFHRIKDLSETFVYFNDDIFLINRTKPTDFFKNLKPVDTAILNVHCYSKRETLVMTPIVDIGIINEHFTFKEVLRNNVLKWFNPIYGKGLVQNIILSSCPRFPGMVQHHLAASLLKNTYAEIWDKEYEILNNTCLNKFRCTTDVNQWLFREWQLAQGKFVPRKGKLGKSFVINKGIGEIISYIERRKGKMICINDADITYEQFEKYKREINAVFEKIFPDKSEYEL